METHNHASCNLLRLIRQDTEHADVELVFQGGIVLTAHANVLASASDYYKEALSTKWTHGTEINENIEARNNEAGSTSTQVFKEAHPYTKSTRSKITLHHPDIDAETAKFVLDFLYLGDVEIPPSIISTVIAF
ncbi:hypothetical protein HDU80_011712, partial [Chytriomyces hyalinus]